MFNNWFKKEKPFQGLMGFGGGATGFLGGGGQIFPEEEYYFTGQGWDQSDTT